MSVPNSGRDQSVPASVYEQSFVTIESLHNPTRGALMASSNARAMEGLILKRGMKVKVWECMHGWHGMGVGAYIFVSTVGVPFFFPRRSSNDIHVFSFFFPFPPLFFFTRRTGKKDLQFSRRMLVLFITLRILNRHQICLWVGSSCGMLRFACTMWVQSPRVSHQKVLAGGANRRLMLFA